MPRGGVARVRQPKIRVRAAGWRGMTEGAEPWNAEWAAERAAEALCYLGRNYPECLKNPRVLDEHETVAKEAAMRGPRRVPGSPQMVHSCRGREADVEIRRGAA